MLAASPPTRRLVARSISQSRRHYYVQLSEPRFLLRSSLHNQYQKLRNFTTIHRSILSAAETSPTEPSSSPLRRTPTPEESVDVEDEAEQKAYLEDEATDEEDDAWNSIVALEASRNDLDWRRKLVTHEDYESESDFDKSSGSSRKLVDTHEADLELWQELFLYRLRNYGDSGGEVVSRHLIPVAGRNKLRLWELPRLWRALEGLALRRSQVLTELVEYINHMRSDSRDGPEDFYRNVMYYIVTKDPGSTSQWHEKLEAVFPEREESKLLFDALCGHGDALQTFSKICFGIPSFTRMYSFVISCLVKKGRIDEILWWHSTLLQHNDVPSAFSAVRSPIEQIRKSGRVLLASRMSSELVAAGCQSLDTTVNGMSHVQPHSSHLAPSSHKTSHAEHLHQRPTDILRSLIDDGRTQLSDDFVARLFSTHFFSLDTIIQGLRAIHQDTVGPLSFQAIIIRVANHGHIGTEHVREVTELLRTGNLGIKSCAFSRLILNLAQENDNDLIDKVVGLGEHPDAFGDPDLQKARYSTCIEKNDREGANVAYTVLRLGQNMSRKALFDVQKSYLENALAKEDRIAIALHMKTILADRIRLPLDLFDQVWQKLMMQRYPGGFQVNHVRRNHANVVRFLQRVMQTDDLVHPAHWKEVLKRIAEARQHRLLRETAHWLVIWAQRQSSGEKFGTGHTFLRSIFDEATVGWIIRSGFHWHYVDKNKKAEYRYQLLIGTHAEKVEALLKDEALFGVRLLKSLNDCGLGEAMPVETLSSACERLLGNMFGPLKITNFRYRAEYDKIRQCRRAELADYAAAIEELWGQKLFWSGLSGPRHERLQDFAQYIVRMACIRSRIDDVAEGLHFALKDIKALRMNRKIYSLEEKVDWAPSNQKKTTRQAAMYERIMRKRLLFNINRLPFVETDWIICEYYPDYATSYLCRPIPVSRNKEGMLTQVYPDYAIANIRAIRGKARLKKVSPHDRAANLATGLWPDDWAEDRQENENAKENKEAEAVEVTSENEATTERIAYWKPVLQ